VRRYAEIGDDEEMLVEVREVIECVCPVAMAVFYYCYYVVMTQP
jgi:hypothetical protein